MTIEVGLIKQGIIDFIKDGAYVRNDNVKLAEDTYEVQFNVHYPNKGIEVTVTKDDMLKILDLVMGDTELISIDFHHLIMYVYIMKELHRE